jgi:hypothetical protein
MIETKGGIYRQDAKTPRTSFFIFLYALKTAYLKWFLRVFQNEKNCFFFSWRLCVLAVKNA